MKIFLAWSGEASKELALLLRQWLPDVIQGLQPFMSAEDIRSGKRWLPEIGNQLEGTNFAITCLTPTNTHNTWIHFEAGAASKVIREASVCCLLFRLQAKDLEFPLAQFQSRTVEREEVRKLVDDINAALGDAKLDADRLRRAFDKNWGDFEAGLERVDTALAREDAPVAGAREPGEVLNDLVSVVQGISTQIREQSDLLSALHRRQLIGTLANALAGSTPPARGGLLFPEREANGPLAAAYLRQVEARTNNTIRLSGLLAPEKADDVGNQTPPTEPPPKTDK